MKTAERYNIFTTGKEAHKDGDWVTYEDHANVLKSRDELTERLKEALEECLLPENIECDGPGCTGCYKDVIHAALTAYKEAKKP